MQKVMRVSSLISRVGVFLIALVCCQAVLAGTPSSGYCIRYKNCSIFQDVSQAFAVDQTGSVPASVKVSRVKKFPSSILFDSHNISTNAPAGTMYLAVSPGTPIPIAIMRTGKFQSFYSEAPIGTLAAQNGVEVQTVVVKDAQVGAMGGEGTFGSVKLSSAANSANWEYARTQLVFISSQSTPISFQSSGIVLTQVLSAQPFSMFTVSSKKCRSAVAPYSLVSIGGVGRVTADAIIDWNPSTFYFRAVGLTNLKATGAYVEPDELMVSSRIETIRVSAVNYGGMSIGGVFGRSKPDLSSSEMLVDAPSIGSVYGQFGVRGNFWMPLTGSSTVAYHQGTIDRISTSPRGGYFSGTAHVKPGSAIRFVPADHPDFAVCDDPTSHP